MISWDAGVGFLQKIVWLSRCLSAERAKIYVFNALRGCMGIVQEIGTYNIKKL